MYSFQIVSLILLENSKRQKEHFFFFFNFNESDLTSVTSAAIKLSRKFQLHLCGCMTLGELIQSL